MRCWRFSKIMTYVVHNGLQRTTASMCTPARRLRGCGISALFLELCVCRAHCIAKTFQIETTNQHFNHITFFIILRFLILLVVFWKKKNVLVYCTLQTCVRFYFCSCLCHVFPRALRLRKVWRGLDSVPAQWQAELNINVVVRCHKCKSGIDCEVIYSYLFQLLHTHIGVRNCEGRWFVCVAIHTHTHVNLCEGQFKVCSSNLCLPIPVAPTFCWCHFHWIVCSVFQMQTTIERKNQNNQLTSNT